MLCIARYSGQKFVIDGQVWIEVKHVSDNGRVELLIDAPRHIEVDREEVFRSKEAGEPRPPRRR